MITVILPNWAFITLMCLIGGYFILETVNKALDLKIEKMRKEIARINASQDR